MESAAYWIIFDSTAQRFDQFRMFPKRQAVAVGKAWAADTRRQIEAEGKWPAKLPRWESWVAMDICAADGTHHPGKDGAANSNTR